eukprot:14135595-Ditylum_brightwellii.AAC.1
MHAVHPKVADERRETLTKVTESTKQDDANYIADLFKEKLKTYDTYISTVESDTLLDDELHHLIDHGK